MQISAHLVLPLADRALHPEHQLLGGLRLLPQDGLGLTSKALLLAIVPWGFDIRSVTNSPVVFINRSIIPCVKLPN